MSRFMMYHGEVRPSDSYFKNHPDFDYNDSDWFSDDYDLEDDTESLYMNRICENCGSSFTLYDTMSEYADQIDWPSYAEEYDGCLCASCAIQETESRFN